MVWRRAMEGLEPNVLAQSVTIIVDKDVPYRLVFLTAYAQGSPTLNRIRW